MPFMFGDAEVPASTFDFVVDDPRGYHDLVGAAEPADPDRGARHCARGEPADPRRRHGADRHRRARRRDRARADAAPPRRTPTGGARSPTSACCRASRPQMRALGGDAPFTQGLYAVTEMFVDGFLDLYRAGILKRRAGADGALLHGAFLLGPRAFYEALRAMPDAERALFRMMPVSFTNELLGPGLGGEGRPAPRCALHQLRDDGDARRRGWSPTASRTGASSRASAASTTSSPRRTRCRAAARSSPCARRARAAAGSNRTSAGTTAT